MNGITLWFTGLPCSGKTTIAKNVYKMLKIENKDVELLDGDSVRKDLTSDLGFSKEDRDENIKRVTYVAKLLTKYGVIVIASFISPYAERRNRTRKEIESVGKFLEIYVKCPVEVCAKRDVKGMYQKAFEGKIKDFTGVNDPYEEPTNPDLILETDKECLEMNIDMVLSLLAKEGII